MACPPKWTIFYFIIYLVVQNNEVNCQYSPEGCEPYGDLLGALVKELGEKEKNLLLNALLSIATNNGIIPDLSPLIPSRQTINNVAQTNSVPQISYDIPLTVGPEFETPCFSEPPQNDYQNLYVSSEFVIPTQTSYSDIIFTLNGIENPPYADSATASPSPPMSLRPPPSSQSSTSSQSSASSYSSPSQSSTSSQSSASSYSPPSQSSTISQSSSSSYSTPSQLSSSSQSASSSYSTPSRSASTSQSTLSSQPISPSQLPALSPSSSSQSSASSQSIYSSYLPTLSSSSSSQSATLHSPTPQPSVQSNPAPKPSTPLKSSSVSSPSFPSPQPPPNYPKSTSTPVSSSSSSQPLPTSSRSSPKPSEKPTPSQTAESRPVEGTGTTSNAGRPLNVCYYEEFPMIPLEINLPAPNIPEPRITIVTAPAPVEKKTSSLKKMLPLILIAMLCNDRNNACPCVCESPSIVPIPYPFPIPFPSCGNYNDDDDDDDDIPKKGNRQRREDFDYWEGRR